MHRSLLASLALFSVSVGTASASIYEYVFTGVVKQRTVYDADAGLQAALNGMFPNDTAYTFRFTLDLSQQTTINQTAVLRTYGNDAAFLGGSLVFGPTEAPVYSATLTSLGAITIRNEENIGTFSSPVLIDGFNLSGAGVSGPAIGAGAYEVDQLTGIAFSFSTVENGLPKALFDSTDMPTSIDRALVRGNFAALQFFFREAGGDESLGFVGGGWGNSFNTPGTVTITAVPEPSSAALLAGAGVALLVCGRRPRRFPGV